MAGLKWTDYLRKATKEKLAEMAASDPLSKEIIDLQHEYLRKIRKWTDISDKAYLESASIENSSTWPCVGLRVPASGTNNQRPATDQP